MKKKHKAPRRTVLTHGPDPIDVHVGHRLREARLLAGINQTELGARIGVSFQAVQKYEQGDNRISASRLFNAAKALQRPVSYFFDEIETNSETPSGSEFSKQEVELIRWLRRIRDERLRDHLRQLMLQVGVSRSGADEDDEPPSNAILA
jgi:transcriptional regulator with XRE-family HTH domain